jgi:membrane-bound lytic murein transglycosylase D
MGLQEFVARTPARLGILFVIPLALAACATLPAEDSGTAPAPEAEESAVASLKTPAVLEVQATARQPSRADRLGHAADVREGAEDANAPPAALSGTTEPPVSPVDAAATEATSTEQAVDLALGRPAAQELAQPAPARHADLWERIRAGFRLRQLDGPLVAAYVRSFSGNPDYIARIGERARLYLFHIVEEIEKRDMPLEIALLPAIESAFQPHAMSHARAHGLWQFMPGTARLYGIDINWWYDGRRDVLASTRAALDYLQKLHNDFNGDWFLALAAYNAGEGRIQRGINQNRRQGRPAEYQNLRLVRETRHYVPKLKALVRIVSNPAAHGIVLPPIPNEPYFAVVETGAQLDFTVASRLSGVPLEELRAINAGFNRIATPPDGPHRILVPVESKPSLVKGLDNLPERERIRWRRHSVVAGDTLGAIARRHGITVQELQRANNLRGTLIRVGADLMIPMSSQPFTAQAARAAAARTTVSAANWSASDKVVHRVRGGDTLWSIARQYNVQVADLAQWNSMHPRDTLYVDQTLRIWPTAVD